MRFMFPLLLVLAGCSTPRAIESTTYHFREGSSMTYAVDDRQVLSIEVRGGRLICNGVDTGPYRHGAPVRFVSPGEIEVDGTRRRFAASE